jgi:DNA ligase (NAD+)
MYNPAQTRQLQQETIEFIRELNTRIKDSKTIDQLRDILRFHEYRYYVLNDPLISDGEYDQLYKALEKMEAAEPSLIRPDSPTQRVARGLSAQFRTVQHLVPMLSLENSYDAEDLTDWDRKARELSGMDELEYCVEPKFDGASISVIYEHDLLVRGATRGDGVEGEEITQNLKQIKSLPLSAAFSRFGIQQVEIRGEVLMNKNNFKKYNDQLAEQNLPPLANPRNAASGTLRIKDSTEVAKRNLEAFLYHISYISLTPGHAAPSSMHTHAGSLEMLWELGFRSPVKEKKLFRGIEGVIQYCQAFEEGRDALPYEIDGLVIKVNSLEWQEKLGMTTHHPRWAIAYKFKARQGTSMLRAVEFQVGRTGSITPVAKIDPVPIGGVTVGSISLHNEDFIREKDIRLGDQVLVERAGDVIPYIVKSLVELRTGNEAPIQFPDSCPVCGDTLYKPEGEAVWRCPNINCKAQVLERMIHFTSKDAMDIRGLGEANIHKFYELGWLKNIPTMYALPFDLLRGMEGFGEKSVANLSEAIEKSKAQPLHRLITALGIRYVGETTAKALARHIGHLGELASYSREDLQQVPDVGVKVAESIFQFFHNEDNMRMLEQLEKMGLNLRGNEEPKAEGNLSGKRFLFTGTLQRMKRADAESWVEQNGGQILSGVSSKLDYLVVGEDAGSKLEKARKIPSIRILDEEGFVKLSGYGTT